MPTSEIRIFVRKKYINYSQFLNLSKILVLSLSQYQQGFSQADFKNLQEKKGHEQLNNSYINPAAEDVRGFPRYVSRFTIHSSYWARDYRPLSERPQTTAPEHTKAETDLWVHRDLTYVLRSVIQMMVFGQKGDCRSLKAILAQGSSGRASWTSGTSLTC